MAPRVSTGDRYAVVRQVRAYGGLRVDRGRSDPGELSVSLKKTIENRSFQTETETNNGLDTSTVDIETGFQTLTSLIVSGAGLENGVKRSGERVTKYVARG